MTRLPPQRYSELDAVGKSLVDKDGSQLAGVRKGGAFYTWGCARCGIWAYGYNGKPFAQIEYDQHKRECGGLDRS